MIPISICHNKCPLRLHRLRGNDLVVTNGENPKTCPGNICKFGHLFA